MQTDVCENAFLLGLSESENGMKTLSAGRVHGHVHSVMEREENYHRSVFGISSNIQGEG